MTTSSESGARSRPAGAGRTRAAAAARSPHRPAPSGAGPSRPAITAAPRSRLLPRLIEPMLRVVTLVGLIVLWELASKYWINPTWISSPGAVWDRFIDGIKDGSLWRNTSTTFEEALLGLIFGTIAGVLAALLLHRARLVARLLDPYILGAYSLPRIALAPFLVVWLGIGLSSKVVLVITVIFFVVLLNVRQGLDTVDPDLTEALRSMRAGPWVVTRHLLIPTVLPWTMSAVKIGVGMALVSAVVGEIVGSTQGLGWYITNSLNQFDITGGVMALLVMAALAMLLYYLLNFIDRRLFTWRRTAGKGSSVPM
jgi:NitT/TauT family transport system permease protein